MRRAAAALLAAVAPASGGFPDRAALHGDVLVSSTGHTIETLRERFEFERVRERDVAHPRYSQVRSTTFQSPPIKLANGEVHFSLPSVSHLPMPAPGVPFALLAAKFDFLDSTGRRVPLSEVYNHHWLVYDEWVGGSGINVGCGGQDTWVSVVFGAGAEMRGVDYKFPDGHGLMQTGNAHWSGNLHFIRTTDLSTEHFNGDYGQALKNCIECDYAPGKATGCLPNLNSYDSFLCCMHGSRCAVNDPSNKTTITYYLTYTLEWTTEIEKVKPVKVYVIDALNCAVAYRLTPNAKKLPKGTTCGDKVCTSVETRAMPESGTIMWAYTHQHGGAIDSSLSVNGVHVCTSTPIYGTDPNNAPGNEKGYAVAFDVCLDHDNKNTSFHVNKGDKLTVTSRYSVDATDMRTQPIPGGGHSGIMNLFYWYLSPDSPSPLPPAPTDEGYVCDASMCVATPSGGAPLAACQAACGSKPPPAPPSPSGEKYQCVADKCVSAPSGFPLATCQLACG